MGALLLVFILIFVIFLSRHTLARVIPSFITAKDTARTADAILIEGWQYPHGSTLRTSVQLKEQGIGKDLFFVEYAPSAASSMTDLEFPRYYHEMLDLYFESENIDPKQIQRIAVELKDPVTWNTTFSVMEALSQKGYRSMILVSPWLHSRRSCDAYTIAGKRRGIEVFCKPVEGGLNRHNWWKSHVGMAAIFGEVIKRIYYIFRIS
jgi:hypothetical protein